MSFWPSEGLIVSLGLIRLWYGLLPLLLPMPSKRSRQSATRVATVERVSFYHTGFLSLVNLPFHSKPSCKRKNSLNAGSSGSCPSFFGVDCCCSPRLIADAFRRCPGVDCLDLLLERHICASMPSICRSPFRIFCVSLDAMLSKARESKASIASTSLLSPQCNSCSECPASCRQDVQWLWMQPRCSGDRMSERRRSRQGEERGACS